MAQRRMFSLQIVDTDAFLDMSQSSQLLYFHLAMRADDDGFVANVKKIMRMVGSNDDDLKILLAKNFLLPFESGVCVIKHWRIHNLIRGDRYNETKYTDEKALLMLKDNGSYSMATNGIPNGNQMAPQVRLGKVSIGKDSIVKDSNSDIDFQTFWNNYPVKKGKGNAEKAWHKLKPPMSEVIAALEAQKKTDQWTKDNGKYIPYPATWLNGKRWEDEVEVATSSKYAKYDA